MNADKIKIVNIFDFHTVQDFIKRQKKVKPIPTREQFAESLRREIMYHFWSRSEFEIVISAWCGGKAEEKVDIYGQLNNNWELFVDLAYKEMLKGKRGVKRE